MSAYVALLRGINVGAKNQLKMADLKLCLEKSGFGDVKTYIQSGNIIFTHQEDDCLKLAATIEELILDTFNLTVPTLVLSKKQLHEIVDGAPSGWGEDPSWKYNVLFLLPPYDMEEVVKGIGELRPDIETLTPGQGVLYQSMSIKLFGRTTTGKLASSPLYKRMTIRNWNTTRKLKDLTQEAEQK